MKKKRLITNMIAIGLVVVAFIGIFLAMWVPQITSDITNTTRTLDGIGIFAEKAGDNAALGTVCEVLLLIALVLGCLYAICYLLGFIGIGKIDWNKVLKLIAIVELLLALVAIVLGIVYCVSQSNVNDYLSTILMPGVGFYMLSLGTLFSGIVGVYANRK